jgi:hypothetical protein
MAECIVLFDEMRQGVLVHIREYSKYPIRISMNDSGMETAVD